MSNPGDYGSKYWRVDTIAREGEKAAQIYPYADSIEIKDGALILWGGYRKGSVELTDKIPTHMLAAGHWGFVAPVSALDGSEVTVDHWYPIDPKTGKTEADRFCR